MFQDSYGELWGVAKQKRIYDYYRMAWVECECIDLGRAFGIWAVASPYGYPNYQPKNRGGRPDENFQRIYDWLQGNGPAFVSEIAQELKMPQPTVDSALRRHPDKFKYQVILRIASDGAQRTARLWEVVG